MLEALGLESSKLSRSEWGIVRSAMLNGEKPRRFSEAFIKEEKEKLYTYREIFR